MLFLVLFLSTVAAMFVFGMLALLALIYMCRRRFPFSPLQAARFENILLGHRGCRHVAVGDTVIPENSMKAFEMAADAGVDGVEIDIRLTSDGHAIVMHDSTIDRLLDGQGSVESMTLADIQKVPFRRVAPTKSSVHAQALEAKLNQNEAKENENSLELGVAPSLDQVILFCKARKLKLMIEVKEWGRPRLMAAVVSRALHQHQFHDSAFVASFNPLFMYWMRAVDVQAETCMLVRRGFLKCVCDSGSERFPKLVKWIAPVLDPVLTFACMYIVPFLLGIGIMGLQNTMISAELVEWYRSRGIVTDIWVSNREAELQHFRSLRATVTTDYVFPRPL